MTSSDRTLERVQQPGEPRCIIHTSINTGSLHTSMRNGLNCSGIYVYFLSTFLFQARMF